MSSKSDIDIITDIQLRGSLNDAIKLGETHLLDDGGPAGRSVTTMTSIVHIWLLYINNFNILLRCQYIYDAQTNKSLSTINTHPLCRFIPLNEIHNQSHHETRWRILRRARVSLTIAIAAKYTQTTARCSTAPTAIITTMLQIFVNQHSCQQKEIKICIDNQY